MRRHGAERYGGGIGSHVPFVYPRDGEFLKGVRAGSFIVVGDLGEQFKQYLSAFFDKHIGGFSGIGIHIICFVWIVIARNVVGSAENEIDLVLESLIYNTCL